MNFSSDLNVALGQPAVLDNPRKCLDYPVKLEVNV